MVLSANFPIGARITLDMLSGNVHPILHRLRGSEPVSWLPAINGWLVTRRDLAVEVMRDAGTFTVDHENFSTARVVGQSMLSLDGAEHRRHRDPFDPPFRRRPVESRFRGPVADHIESLIDGFADKGRGELRRDFAGPVAVKTMITALGLEERPVSAVLGWYDTIVETVTQVTAGKRVSEAGRAAFAALKASLLPSLKGDPETSLLAAASGMANGLSDDEVVSNAAVLLFGGIETTEGMIANALYFLLTNPPVLNDVYDDPGLIPAVVEESLRMEPAAAVVDRYAVRDVRLGEAKIKANDLVQVSLAGANRDPAVFEEPDRFDPKRPNLSDHVTFAQGPHVCLGLHLARLEAQLSLERLLARLPGLRLVDGGKTAEPRGLVFRKPEVVEVRWLV